MRFSDFVSGAGSALVALAIAPFVLWPVALASSIGKPSGGGGSTRGLFSAAPICNGLAANTTYFAEDANLVGQCDGSTWSWHYAEFVAYPTSISATPTWLHQNGASVANNAAGSGVILIGTQSSVTNIQARVRTVPATPYTYVVCSTSFSQTQFTEFNVYWTDGTDASTSKLESVGVNMQVSAGFPGAIHWDKYTNSTTFSASYAPSPIAANNLDISPPKCVGLVDDGTNRRAGYSTNGTIWFTGNYPQQARTTFLTPTNIGYGVNSNGGQGTPMMMIFSENVFNSALF